MFKFYFSGLKKPVKPVKLPGQDQQYGQPGKETHIFFINIIYSQRHSIH